MNMESEKATHYAPIRDFEEGKAFLDNARSSSDSDQYLEERRFKQSKSYYAAFKLQWLLHVFLLSISASFLAVSRLAARECINKLSEYSPGLLAFNDQYQTVRFDGRFGKTSPYKGPVTPEVDARWSRIENMGAIRISEEEFNRLNASKHAVKVPSHLGGGYQALPEFVHQIHCVKMLWELSYPEYYTESRNRSISNPQEFHDHIDHCADLLRQKLMCDADMTLITYNWLNNHYAPHPNFNVQHKCRNFDAAMERTLQHKINASTLEHNYIPRPEEPVVEFDEPPFDPLADA